MILVAGGSQDPHVHRVLEVLRRRDLDHRALLVGPDAHPRIRIDLHGEIELDGEALAPTVLWLRHDVFAAHHDPRPAVRRRALAWWDALSAWAWLRPEVRLPNRRFLGRATNKIDMLARARRHGLRVPRTVLSNDLAVLHALDGEAWIAKPVSGGSLARPLTDALDMAPEASGALPSPAIVQERLVAPELRVYRVGASLHSFEMRSPQLDYRDDDDTEVIPHPGPPAQVGRALVALAEEVGLDLCAADLKTCPRTGELVFLELNSQPMFEAHDLAARGAVSEAIAELLAPPPLSPPDAG